MKTKSTPKDLWINIISIIAILLLAINITVAKDKTIKGMNQIKSPTAVISTLDNSKKDNPALLNKNVNTDNKNIKYKYPIINIYKIPQYKIIVVF